MRVLVLGADGFIGRHICYALRAAGCEVLASARRTSALAGMGFAVLRADLADPVTQAPAFWRPHLAGGVHLVNAAGLLTGSEAAFKAVHVTAPHAAMAALDGGRAVLVSAVGIDRADTAFSRWRTAGEAAALAAGAIVLRPGLVVADTSYGGSSLLRALAAMPLRVPVVGEGSERFNPVHAADLAEAVARCLHDPPGQGPWEIGGAETVTQAELLTSYRAWLGVPAAPLLHLPPAATRVAGRIGDALRLGPVSATALAQVEAGVLADPAPFRAATGLAPRGLSAILAARPAGTQDLWQARLYLLKPLIRLTLALLWAVSGLLGLLLPADRFLPFLSATGLPDAALIVLARAGGAFDLALAAALLRDWRPRLTGLAQLALVGAYTVGLTLLAPSLWLAPFGELLKNLPILALILVHLALAEER